MEAVALVGPSWPLRGGIARTTAALASALEGSGRLAGFLVPHRQYPGWLYPGRRDTDPSACPQLAMAQPCFSVMEPWTWPRLLQRLRALDASALVLPYWTAAWAPLELFLARFASLPFVAVVHNAADHDSGVLARCAARAVLGRGQGFMCHAAEVARHMALQFPNTPTAVHPLPPEYLRAGGERRDAARARFGLAADRTAILCFGLIRPYKGVDVLLDAVARLPAEVPLVLLLAGEPWGRLARDLQRRLSRTDFAGRVVARLAWIPENEIADWFAAADAAVLPYRSATGSAVAAQALGFGLPIVGSHVGGIGEVVEEGVSGLLVPPGDPAALAAALARIADPSLRARLRVGVQSALQRWSWASYASALMCLVDRVVTSRGREPRRAGRA